MERLCFGYSEKMGTPKQWGESPTLPTKLVFRDGWRCLLFRAGEGHNRKAVFGTFLLCTPTAKGKQHLSSNPSQPCLCLSSTSFPLFGLLVPQVIFYCAPCARDCSLLRAQLTTAMHSIRKNWISLSTQCLHVSECDLKAWLQDWIKPTRRTWTLILNSPNCTEWNSPWFGWSLVAAASKVAEDSPGLKNSCHGLDQPCASMTGSNLGEISREAQVSSYLYIHLPL